ncbi:MAG: ATP-dependent zinc metalloprotease FtsH [Enterobacterales bacterium]|nr:ATP-dependent zinc metalloprotease FtsH [Enterobacterales bacterium]
MNETTRNLILWLVIGTVLFMTFNNFENQKQRSNEIEFSQLMKDIDRDKVSKVTVAGLKAEAQMKNGDKVKTNIPIGSHELLATKALNKEIDYSGEEPEGDSLLWTIFITWGPMLLLIGVWIFFMRQMQGGGKGGAMSFGKSKARLLSEDQIKTNFSDVAGCEEAKEEVAELVDFLKEPSKFQKLGGQIPRGILMVGPPGTGKTLLAKAISGEAKVPFFTISGSDFVEMFVGVGASRVRDMFVEAKKQAPCIIFIDEIDAVGRHRGAGLGGGHDEREQTLNQLLVEMDGFDGDEGVIVIAATNRPDVLDPALLRPGRFDRQVTVGLPDIKGREQILKVHMRKVPLGDDVKPSVIARGTPGMSGADLANLVNEAALFAAKASARKVNQEFFEKAKDKILMGAERRSMVMDDEEKLNTAWHEAGHAIVGYLTPSSDPVYKVTIIPRGRALGVTMQLPEKDRYSHTKEYLESRLSILYGGRIAEEMLNGPELVTTGASNDIQRATEIARSMITKWGFSEKLGPLVYAEDEGEVFLGRSVTQTKHVSDDTARIIDHEVKDLIGRNYDRAEKILHENRDKLELFAAALMKYETIDASQMKEIMSGNEPSAPADWDDSDEPPTVNKSTKPKGKSGDSTIGGPAESH